MPAQPLSGALVGSVVGVEDAALHEQVAQTARVLRSERNAAHLGPEGAVRLVRSILLEATANAVHEVVELAVRLPSHLDPLALLNGDEQLGGGADRRELHGD